MNFYAQLDIEAVILIPWLLRVMYTLWSAEQMHNAG